jgi:hypothetical protein
VPKSRPAERRFPSGRALAALGVVLLAAGCGAPERRFDAERAYGHLVTQVEIGPRAPGTDGHARGAAYLRSHLEATADRVSAHRFHAISPLDSTSLDLTNLVAVFTEDAPKRILFGAHWDTRVRSDEEEDEALRNRPVPGANDGASGVAVLLELATALAEHPPGVGVDLVLFDGEDQGVEADPDSWALGSQAFVRDHPAYRPAFVVVIDMVGRTGTRIPREAHSVLAAGPLVEAVWAAGRDLGLTVLADSLGGPVVDDHIPFLRAGIPAIDLIDLEDPDWHTTRDLPGNCSPEPLGEIGALLLELIARAEASLSP